MQNNIPWKLVVVTSPDPVRPGETMDVELTVTNAGIFDRTGVVLTLEYPDGLDRLDIDRFDGDWPGSRCNPRERPTSDLGTPAAGPEPRGARERPDSA